MTEHHSYTVPCGLILLAIGLFIRYRIGRRRFNRRGKAGLQQFPTFVRAVWVTALEKLIFFIGNLSLLAWENNFQKMFFAYCPAAFGFN